jgi:hypothetical protein
MPERNINAVLRLRTKSADDKACGEYAVLTFGMSSISLDQYPASLRDRALEDGSPIAGWKPSAIHNETSGLFLPNSHANHRKPRIESHDCQNQGRNAFSTDEGQVYRHRQAKRYASASASEVLISSHFNSAQ